MQESAKSRPKYNQPPEIVKAFPEKIAEYK
jgi:hypothetical protein